MSQGPAGEEYPEPKSDDSDSYWDDYHTPFQYEANMAAAEQERRELANVAVKEAIEGYYKQRWYQTAFARVRFGLYWLTYVMRLRVALFIIGAFSKQNDLRFTQKVFFKLGI